MNSSEQDRIDTTAYDYDTELKTKYKAAGPLKYVYWKEGGIKKALRILRRINGFGSLCDAASICVIRDRRRWEDTDSSEIRE